MKRSKSEKMSIRAQRKQAWLNWEARTTPRTRAEFVSYALMMGLAIFGFYAFISLFLGWAKISLATFSFALLGGFAIASGAVQGQKMRETLDEQEKTTRFYAR